MERNWSACVPTPDNTIDAREEITDAVCVRDDA